MAQLSQTIAHHSESLKISFAPLSISEVYQLAECPDNGAVVVMSGTVRNQTEGKPVTYLEYQAYEPMAINIFRSICDRIYSQWKDTKTIIIHHRIGKLSIGEISVLVAVGCPHRAEAFEACRYAIDTLKHNAPIWKKEHFQDGATSWVSIGACEEFNHSNAYKL
ncbi:molybdenum cofactor biosynthesis protein MoaE [Cyanobacterium stanieri LEGE 03274]|uniref:Molybdenum cofactor biosynthesis protein MoaE n=1 Tax=Cyanobacterium stanieri LEGE 03274 TaxID=1828756 RepID=A0ABR9V1E5_9CHRO|nr:molybdenum cofactor biosynthesis protein MoaE [Cyanobacterium stanieri]MBE9221710.1 molybdenum cofactor biosynthesis protein MoaE [Cyanobacterium stanieri LEGE 03274]